MHQAQTDRMKKIIDNIKLKIKNSVENAYIGPGTYHLYCDASKIAAGWYLSRSYKDKIYIMGYGSRIFNQSQRNYSASKKELLAIVFAV